MNMMNIGPLVSYSDYEIFCSFVSGEGFLTWVLKLIIRVRRYYTELHVLGWQLENLGLASEPQPFQREAVTLTTATAVAALFITMK